MKKLNEHNFLNMKLSILHYLIHLHIECLITVFNLNILHQKINKEPVLTNNKAGNVSSMLFSDVRSENLDAVQIHLVPKLKDAVQMISRLYTTDVGKDYNVKIVHLCLRHDERTLLDDI